MISRRNIRVKVMQALYTADTLDDLLKPGGTPENIAAQLSF